VKKMAGRRWFVVKGRCFSRSRDSDDERARAAVGAYGSATPAGYAGEVTMEAWYLALLPDLDGRDGVFAARYANWITDCWCFAIEAATCWANQTDADQRALWVAVRQPALVGRLLVVERVVRDRRRVLWD